MSNAAPRLIFAGRDITDFSSQERQQFIGEVRRAILTNPKGCRVVNKINTIADVAAYVGYLDTSEHIRFLRYVRQELHKHWKQPVSARSKRMTLIVYHLHRLLGNAACESRTTILAEFYKRSSAMIFEKSICIGQDIALRKIEPPNLSEHESPKLTWLVALAALTDGQAALLLAACSSNLDSATLYDALYRSRDHIRSSDEDHWYCAYSLICLFLDYMDMPEHKFILMTNVTQPAPPIFYFTDNDVDIINTDPWLF